MQYFQGEFEERCQSTGAPDQLSFFTAACSIIFLMFNIPGNLMVIVAVAHDPNKNLRTPFNYLMANLALADLIVGTVTEPLSVFIHFKEGLDKSLARKELETLHISYYISCTASVFSMGSLAVERYLAIRNPHSYRNKITAKRILVTITAVWIASLSLPLIYFEVGFITYAFMFANMTLVTVFVITCLIHGMTLKTFHQRRTRYAIRETVVEMKSQSMTQDGQISLNPATVLAPAPSQDYKHVHQTSMDSTPGPSRSYNSAQSVTRSSTTISDANDRGVRTISNTTATAPNSSFHEVWTRSTSIPNAMYTCTQEMEQKLTKMFLVVLIAMLCCYGPSTVLIYVMCFCTTCSCNTLHCFRDLQFLFVIMNSSVNFYCYAIRSRRFRKAFAHILRVKESQRGQPPIARDRIRSLCRSAFLL